MTFLHILLILLQEAETELTPIAVSIAFLSLFGCAAFGSDILSARKY